MRLKYYRFLLSPLDQGYLPFSGEYSREEVINKIFSPGRVYTFPYGRFGSVFGFVTKKVYNKKAFGRIGRQRRTKFYLSPEEGFQEMHLEDWPGSDIFINLADEKTSGLVENAGQVIAIQSNRTVISNPTNCLRALADRINYDILDHGYYLSINPILEKKKNFWSVVNEYEGQITKVVLIYTPPNLFELENKLEEDLKRANRDFNTTSVQIVLENDKGELNLSEDNALLNESAKYVDLGGGNYRISVRDGERTIKSEDGIKSEIFKGKELKIDGASDEDIKRIMRQIFNLW